MRRLLVFSVALGLALAPIAAAQVGFEGAVLPPRAHTVRPVNLYLSVDGTLVVTKMHWVSWGGKIARGYGEAEYHGCTPNCAAAPAHHARAMVALSEIRRCSHHLSWYSHVTVYTRRPSGKYRLYEADPTNWAPCQK